MSKKILVPSLATLVLALVSLSQGQTKIYRVGVILEGGPYYAAVDGLKDGLKELGFGEGQQYVLEIRDLKGERKAAEAAAKSLEGERVDLLYALGTSVTEKVGSRHAWKAVLGRVQPSMIVPATSMQPTARSVATRGSAER